MKMIRTRACGAILGIWWLAGCGSNADLGGFSSTIDGKTEIDKLTTAQQQTLCDEVTSFSKTSGLEQDMTELLCRYGGILAAALTAPDGATDAQVRAACQTGYDMCISTQSSGTCNVAGAATCTATVAELSACLNDGFESYQAALKATPPCSAITAAAIQSSQSSSSPAPPQPPSCVTYQQKCSSQTMM